MPENEKLIVEPFSRKDIKKLAVEGVQEAYEKGEIVDHGTYVKANPELAGTEQDLTGLQVENTKFKVPQPTTVVANPTLAGTEDALTGLQVGSTKYKVAGGTRLYKHNLTLSLNSAFPSSPTVVEVISTDGNPMSFDTLKGALSNPATYPKIILINVGGHTHTTFITVDGVSIVKYWLDLSTSTYSLSATYSTLYGNDTVTEL